jgi:hypothetical protein
MRGVETLRQEWGAMEYLQQTLSGAARKAQREEGAKTYREEEGRDFPVPIAGGMD